MCVLQSVKLNNSVCHVLKIGLFVGHAICLELQ